MHTWGSRTTPAPFWPPLDSRARVVGVQPHQITSGMFHHISPSVGVTMASTRHGAQSFQIWCPKRWPPPTKSGPSCNFCFIKFFPKGTAEAPEASCSPLFHPLPLGLGPPLCQISSQSVHQSISRFNYQSCILYLYLSINTILLQTRSQYPFCFNYFIYFYH